VIPWQLPGPYRVAFTTREGGVSSGAYASLNLGAGGDDPGAVSENRRIACQRLGLEPDRLALNRQRHGTRVNRAAPGLVGEVGDGLWTDEPELPLLALGADCVPIAIAATSGPPAIAVVHAGWRGLAAGVVSEAVAAFGGAESSAVIGPAIGPCCYQVGSEVSRLFDDDLTREGFLDLWEASARALERAGVGRVECLELCTHCNPERFFSHRGSGAGRHGSQGVIGALER
jgi:YfiH family protein